MASATYKSAGILCSATGDVTVTWPAGGYGVDYDDGDLAIMLVETGNQAVAEPADWDEAPSSPHGSGTPPGVGSCRLTIFWKIISGSQSSVTLTDPGDHCNARIFIIEGADPGDPFDTSATGTIANSSTITWPSLATSDVARLILLCAAYDNDFTGDITLSSITNGSLSGLAARFSSVNSQGAGGGVGLVTGVAGGSGSIGTTTATKSVGLHVPITLAINPAPPPAAGTMAVVEAPDAADLDGVRGSVGSLGATDSFDSASMSGGVAGNRSGTLSATDPADAASFAGVYGLHGTMAATEAQDDADFVGHLGKSGALAATEGLDLAEIIGSLPPSGGLVASESPDVFSGAGVVPYPPIEAFLQRASPGPFITMFQLDLTMLGGDLLYFTAGTYADPETGAISEIEFDGNRYVPLPIMASGFEKSAKGPLARPRLQVGNVTNLGTQLLRDHQGLLGARLTRIRTLAQYLDTGPMPDPTQVLPYETYIVSRKVQHNKVFIEFELRAAIDLEGVVCPKRVLLRQCAARYRIRSGSSFTYDTSDMACPYVGSVYFNDRDELVVSPSDDKCSQTITGCKARFGENSALPYLGFPSAAKARG